MKCFQQKKNLESGESFMEGFLIMLLVFVYVSIGVLVILKCLSLKGTGDYPSAVVQVVGVLTWPIILALATALAFKEASEERKMKK